MSKPSIKKLSELKKTDYKSESVKKELARNLENKLKSGTPTFEFIHGYETVSYTHLTLPTICSV